MEKVSEIKILSTVGVLVSQLFYIQTSIKMQALKNIFLFAAILIAFTACQQELEEIVLPAPAEAFAAESATASLLQRISLQDGSEDNILDSASCTLFVMPLTVFVNGQELIVNNVDDLKYVERIMDESETDTDELTIIFPVTIRLANHAEIQVLSEDELEDITEQCEEGGTDDDIECVDLQYPISLSEYNVSNEIAKVITLGSDKELHDFIENMDENQLVSISFPIKLIQAGGFEQVVANNDQLNAAIEMAEVSCDEDDDSDFEEDDVDTSNLVALLLDGSWKIEYYFDETEQTSQLADYSLSFYADGTAIAVSPIVSLTGTWNVYGDDAKLEVIFDFGEDEPWVALREDWIVKSATDVLLELKGNEDEVGARSLVFKKN